MTKTDTSSGFKQAEIQVSDAELRLLHSAILKPGKVMAIGRHSTSAIRLRGVRVSRRHAVLELQRDGLYLTDLGSANGLTVDGLEVPPNVPVLLRPSQRIEIADYTITFTTIGFTEEEGAETRRMSSMFHTLGQDLELLGKLGTGSNASVWSAYDARAGRKVAVKLLRMSASDTSTQRFVREAEISRRVDSPNVVKVYDVRFVGEQPLILMELVEGPSALERLQSLRPEPMSVAEALRIAEDVARALEAAAEAGVVHRDVKPSNILLGRTGAKLSDFGIAKHMGGVSMTRPGQGLGTLAYVAPEQAESAKTVDARADVYSLGGTLYHLLSGAPPFDPEQPMAVLLRQIMSEMPPPLGQVRPDVPVPLVQLIEAMLSKAPEQRPPIRDVVASLFGIRRASGMTDGEDTTWS